MIGNDLALLDKAFLDLEYFRKNFEDIRERLEGEFIAIKNQKIVAFAPDKSILIKKLKKEGIDESEVLIEYVKPKGEIIIL